MPERGATRSKKIAGEQELNFDSLEGSTSDVLTELSAGSALGVMPRD